jgi:hypothetical protein
MILRGILERSLGGFVCIRGYAALYTMHKSFVVNKRLILMLLVSYPFSPLIIAF